MKKLLMAGVLATLGAFAAPELEFGPSVNRDDQCRFFWLMGDNVLFPYGVDLGLNLIYSPYYGAWYALSKAEQDADTERRHRLFRQMETNGIDIVEFVTARARLNRPDLLKTTIDGKQKGDLDYSLPETRRLLRARWEKAAEVLKGHPNVIAINASSETEASPITWSAAYADACEKALGFKPPREITKPCINARRLCADFPASGVVSKDYKPLKYLMWFWKDGCGNNTYNEDCSETYNRVVGRRLPYAYDPVTRCPPIWGSGGKNLDIGGQWFYALAQPFGVSFIVSEQKAMARGVPGMKIFTILQCFAYNSILTPKEKNPPVLPAWKTDRPNGRHYTMPPDLMREALWTLFSRQVDGIGFHGQEALIDMCWVATTEEEKEKARLRGGYQFTNPETRLVVRDLLTRVAIPLGPLFRTIPERPAQVGLLQCATSSLLAETGCSWGWGSSHGDLWIGANFTPHVLYEEEIARDGIPPTLKVIAAPDCAAMLDTTRDALLAFQKRGGIILGDGKLVPAVLPDLDLPTGLIPRYNRQERAKEDRAVLKRVIPQLKRDLAPFVKPYADSANGDILVSARTYRKADYVFAVNDKRTCGDYVGQWGSIEEKGLPNEGVVTIARGDTRAVYDLVAHRAVPFRVKDGRTEIDVSYKTTDGRIFLVLPRKLGPLTVRREGDEVVVTSKDKDVMIPIAVKVDGAKPRTGVVEDGVWRRKYPHGARLRVVNLANGEGTDK